MYADKIFLSLTIITLSLAPGYFGYDVACPVDEKELHTILENADKSQILSVVYFVNDDSYDPLFVELARKFYTTVFIKVNTQVVTISGQTIDLLSGQPEIMFHKYGINESPFFCNDKIQLEILINYRIDLNSTAYLLISKIHKSAVQLRGKLNKDFIQQESFGINCPQNLKAFFEIIQTADTNEKLCLIYRVTSTNDYDKLFYQLATKYSSTVYVKIDVNKITMQNEIIFSVNTQPGINFYKFGCSTGQFSSTNKNELSNIIVNLENMTKNDFCELAKKQKLIATDESLIRDQLHQVRSLIKVPGNIIQFSRTLQSACGSDKLCLVYQVVMTDEYDEIFYKLASEYSSTEFIKIDISNFRSENNGYIFSIETQPTINFHKYGCNTSAFSSTDENELSNIIKSYNQMSREEFCNLQSSNAVDGS